MDSNEQYANEKHVITLDLEPIALLYHSNHYFTNGHRKLAEEEEMKQDDDNHNHNPPPPPTLSFHPYINAVYSSMVEIDDESNNIDAESVERHNAIVGEMNASRHLSRFEKVNISRSGLNHEKETMGIGSYSRLSNNDTLGTYEENWPFGDNDGRRRLQQQENINLRGGLPLSVGVGVGTNEENKGRLYDDFQSAPLSQGYGTHYATVWVGTPTPQRKTLIVDTGSHHTAFPCKGCIDCGEDHHTDVYFDPDKSRTFTPLKCNECKYESKCSPIGDEFETSGVLAGMKYACMVRQSYTEGSSWAAYQAKDRLFCGGKDVLSAADPLDQRFSVDFVFGCKVHSSGLFHSQLADGIMGLSHHEAALPSVMLQQGKIKEGIFSLCFRKEFVVSKKGISAGVITFGGINQSLWSSPMRYAKNTARSGWYTVYVKNVFLQPGNSLKEDTANIVKVDLNTHAINADKGVIIDSGTTDTYLHKSLSEPFNKVWKSITGYTYSNAPVRLTREQLHSLPTIYIQIMAYDNKSDVSGTVSGLVGDLDPKSANDVLLTIPATHYMEYSPSKDVYTPRFYFTESNGSVLGANALQGHDVMFDWQNGRIGFAESECKISQSSWDGEGLAEGSRGRGEDCILQEEIISEACFETVDPSQCVNRHFVLQGHETKIMSIEFPGTVNGMNCVDVIKRNIFQNNLAPAQDIHCNELGICTSVQKCEMTCEQYVNAKDMKEAFDLNETERKRCKGSWSSCLESCNQSKLTSTLMADGQCHEMKDSRVSRTCHTEYCGINDPCAMPFVVHVILAFRGVNNERWNKGAEESLIESFSETVHNSLDEKMFEPTDVELLITSPWYDDLTDGEGVQTEVIASGVKVVLEVHLYNEHAYMKNIDHSSSSSSSSECGDSDIFEFAQKAHEIHYNLEQNDFMKKMGRNLEVYHNNNHQDTSGIFAPFFSDEKNMNESMVVSSWTIKTAVNGKGSIYDHKLDPFPGAINYVHVSSAYVGQSEFSMLSIIILIALAFKVFQHRRRQRVDTSSAISGGMTFIPKPFEFVTSRKLGTGGAYNKKFSDDNNTKEETSSLVVIRNSKTRSTLQNVLYN